MKEAGSRGGDHSPQGELLDRADRYARMVILGQTMSGSQDASKGGGKAFGSVEATVKDDWIDAAGEYVAGVINAQLIPAVCVLNYGDCDVCPSVRFLEEEEGDQTEAQRDMELAKGGLRIGEDFLYKKYGIPKPGADEECIGGAVEQKEKDLTTQAPTSQEVEAKSLAEIAEIEDDAVFARALASFADALLAQNDNHDPLTGQFASKYGPGFTKNPMTSEEQSEQQRIGEAAIDQVIDQKTDVHGAMSRPDTGAIAFHWGNEGGGPPKNKGAKGIAGIIAKHGEADARKMPETIAKGELGPFYEQGRKRNIRHGDYTAILALVKDNNSHVWLLNGFGPEEKK